MLKQSKKGHSLDAQNKSLTMIFLNLIINNFNHEWQTYPLQAQAITATLTIRDRCLESHP